MQSKKIYLTGANGFLGSALKSGLQTRGYEVISLVRSPHYENDVPFDLSHETPFSINFSPGAFIHCAWSLAEPSSSYLEVNVEGSSRVLHSAQKSGMSPLIFISSSGAFSGCRSLYGKSKLEVERFVRSLGGMVVRPGLIFSLRNSGGMMGKLERIAKLLPLIPLIDDGKQVFFMSEADALAGAIAQMIENPSLYCQDHPVLANPTPITFRQIFESITGKLGLSRFFVSIPSFFIRFPLRIARTLHIPLPVNEDNLEGLLGLPSDQPINTEVSKRFVGLTVKS